MNHLVSVEQSNIVRNNRIKVNKFPKAPVLNRKLLRHWIHVEIQTFPKNLVNEAEYVVKKCNQYTAIVTSKFRFLDISNYLAVGCSYSKFLKAYDVRSTKGYFPYEWFDDVSKHKVQSFPAYECFYSRLKMLMCWK